jgi:hypothetical protein
MFVQTGRTLTRPVLRSQQTPIAIAAVVACFGAYTFYSTSTRKSKLSTGNEPPVKTFGSGPAFTSLRLHSVEKLNHDSSRFRFSLPSEEAVSGLSLTCMATYFPLNNHLLMFCSGSLNSHETGMYIL